MFRRATELTTLLLLAAACGPQAAPSRRPNVLWISLDTLRADRLSCYGHGRETSPNIDALAAEGVLFERAMSTSSWTLPAHASMLSGLPVSVHGACFKVHPELRGSFVAESARAAGYATAGFYSHTFLERDYFAEGFDTWQRVGSLTALRDELRRQWEAAQASGDQKGMKRLAREHQEAVKHARPEAGEGVDQVLDWLDRQRRTDGQRPFFLFVHVFDIHSPYDPPEPYDRCFDRDYAGDIESVVVRGQHPGRGQVLVPHPDEDPEGFQRALDLYDGEIAWVDSQIGRLLARLEQLAVADETLVVLSSDHGDEFFEHGQTGHSKTLLRESVHVPLVLRLPGVLPAGARVAEPVSILDLAPTVLTAIGASSPVQLPGLDLGPLAHGETALPRTVVSELTRAELAEDPSWQVSLYRQGERVIVHQPFTPEQRAVRFDLQADPLELGDGSPVEWGSAAGVALARELEALRGRYRGLRASLEPRGARVTALDELAATELAALGYAGADELSGGDGERLCMEGCIWRTE